MQNRLTTKSNSPSLLFLALLFLFFVSQVHPMTLVVTPNNNVINAVTYFDWNITGLTGTVTSVVLRFPSIVTLNATGTTTVLLDNGTAYAGTLAFVGNNVTVQIVAGMQTNSSLFFRVTNIKNPYYSYSDFAYTYQSANTAQSFIRFQKGPITNCSLSFVGVTDTLVSTAYLDFKTTNPINNSRTLFKIYYGSYTSLTTKITENNILSCAYSVNGGATFSGEVSATYPSPGSPIFDCDFSGVNLTANSAVRLRFSNARNPPYKNNYLIDAFRVQTLDGINFYDASTACTLTDVAVDTYEASYTQFSKLINTNYPNPAIESIQQISKNFGANDMIIIEHDGIEFTVLGTYIMMYRVSSAYPSIQFSFVSGSGTTAVKTQSGVGNAIQENKKVGIQLTNFNIKMPSSMTPLNITFRFLRYYSANPTLNLQFLNIFATLKPASATFDLGDLNITALNTAINDKSTYIFKINISQPLSPSCFLLLNLPLELDLSQFSSASTCIFQSTSSNANALCSVYNQANKVVMVAVNSTSGVAKDQVLTVTIGDIGNPVDPERGYLFGVQTYYLLGDTSSKVELGAGLYNMTYTYRTMNITALTPIPSYTVDYFPSILTLRYTPGVKLPANLILTFTFFASITQINYKNVTVNGVSFVYSKSQLGQIINLTVSNQVQAGAQVLFRFQFKAPSSVANYQAVNVSVRSAAGVLYEKTAGNLAIDVSFAASQVFSLTPVQSITGATTTYTLSFYTNVLHPNPFYLSIQFPSDVRIPNTSATSCSPSSTCKGIIPISSTVPQQLYLNMTPSATTNTYTVNLTNIINPRKIGSSGVFNLATLTNSTNGNLILSGSVTVTIAYPNTANAFFDLTKSYYRDNVEPVTIGASFFNDLLFQDFLRVRFDYRTYGLAGPASNVRCTNGITCEYDATQSTSFNTVIKVTPTSAQTLTQPITFTIEGLKSSSTTYPSQKFQISIRSYSSDDRQMDQTTLIYNISCASSTALLAKTCQTCNEHSSICYTCYPGYYLLNQACVTDCTSSSQYRAFQNSTLCINCINSCNTCISATSCITCVSNFYLYENSSCLSQCNTETGGYYVGVVGGQGMCLRCWSQSCVKCTDGGSSSCLNCGNAFMDPSNPGRCIGTCDLSSNYKPTVSQCLPCNSRCLGCNGSSYADCITCRPGYYNVSGSCETSCPQYTVPMSDRTCNCSGRCQKCQLLETRCITCKDPTQLLYNYQCISGCPDSTYLYFGQCIDCNPGCLNCTVNSCTRCLDGYNVFESRCYTECNTVGERYTAINGTCVQCPTGCDMCNIDLQCSVCLANYTLVGTVCTLTCQLQKNCEKVSPVPEKIIPLPGMITVFVWLIVLVVLKLFIINKIYMPYSYIFISCIVEIVLVIAVLAKMNDTIKLLLANATSARLLQTVSSSTELPQSYQYAVVGILAADIALNYIANFVYLFLFCRYLMKYIPDRQIDKISNYAVVVVGMLSNYRFSLLAYSKLFPKPNILVQNQSKLTPIHYMCIASILTSFLPLSAACILIYNEYALTDLFMLGIDLLIIVIMSLIFTIWMVSVDKPAEYFQGMKKYTKEDVNFTTEGFNEKENMNMSNQKLANLAVSNLDNSVIHVQDINEEIQEKKPQYGRTSGVANLSTSNRNPKNIKSDNENDPLPNIPIRSSHINIETMKVKARDEGISHSEQDSESLQEREKEKEKEKERKKIEQTFSEKKTQRNRNNKTDIKKNAGNELKVQAQHDHPQVQKGIKSRNKEAPKNFSKEKRAGQKKQKRGDDLNIKINEISGETDNNDSQYMEESLEVNEPSMNKAQSDIIKKSKKPLKSQTQRSSAILPVTMKKKESFGVFESQQAVSQIDEIDFQSLIQTKMIDKTKQKQKTVPAKQEEVQHEEISPSWFNQQNQRFDFQESSDT